MNRKIVLSMAVIILLSSSLVVHAQTGGGYDLTWSTIDSGGYTFSAGGSFSVGGAIGQPDAGLLSGGNYSLGGGFWGGGKLIGVKYYLYLPLTLRQSP